MTRMKVVFLGGVRTECTHESGAKIIAESPKEGAFWATDLFAASIGMWIITIIGMAAKELEIDLKGASFEIEKLMSTGSSHHIDKVILHFHSPLSLDKQAREKLEKAAMNCPVYVGLNPSLKVETNFAWGK